MNDTLSKLNEQTFRSLFYLVTPNESTFLDVADVPRYVDDAVSWFVVLILLEMSILKLQQKNDSFAINDTVTSINAGILSIVCKFGGRTVCLGLYIYIYNNYRLVDLPSSSSTTWFIGFLAEDFVYYLTHRAVHEAGVFWSLHQIHHSSEYYNLSTALRQACLAEYGTIALDLLQSVIIPPPIYLVHRHFNLLYQFWIHTETIESLGPLEYILNTPSHHRVHHGRNPYCIDKNYGGTLIIWDRLFGTFEWERADERPVYGLVDAVNSFNQLYLQLFEFKSLGWDKGRLLDENGSALFPGFMNKVKAALYPPGYFIGSRTKQFFLWRSMVDPTEGVPQVNKIDNLKYNPPLSTSSKTYSIIQFFIILSIFIQFTKHRSDLAYSTSFIYIILIVSTMQTLGYFFDKGRSARSIEIIRLLLSVLIMLFIFNDLIYSLIFSLSLIHLVIFVDGN